MANFVLMVKRKIIPDPLLMLVTILVVTGFQVYWLKNSYDREKRALQIKANMAFQDAVRRLQVVKLKLKDPFLDTTHPKKMRVVANNDLSEPNIAIHESPQLEMATMVNAMRDKIRDSLKNSLGNPAVIISVNDSNYRHSDDSSHARVFKKEVFERVNGNNKFFEFLYRVDSLQDSLKIREINTEYRDKLKEENLPVPFKIIRTDSIKEGGDPDFTNVTVGFAHPVTYHVQLGNSFPYLIKRITPPILFSLFLVGVTILSFVVLYRNLLKQRRLAELKNEFIGNITHELKTPIATVGVAIEALKNFNAIQDTERTKEYLDISANELQRLSLLVDKVLKLSMFEKKEIDLKYEYIDWKDLVDEVVDSMRLQIEKLDARVFITQHGNTNLEADRLHLLSVVFNLLDNALKYSKDKPVINIGLAGDEHSVQFNIADNGIGIAPEYKNKIFEKFFRVPAGNTHNAKGYGLGLSYVAQVVEKHHGQISVDSEAGRGTTITIVLPRKQV
jgi:two-component system, OmpR family, phosphate regulon sensor histidine kinase PhoR